MSSSIASNCVIDPRQASALIHYVIISLQLRDKSLYLFVLSIKINSNVFISMYFCLQILSSNQSITYIRITIKSKFGNDEYFKYCLYSHIMCLCWTMVSDWYHYLYAWKSPNYLKIVLELPIIFYRIDSESTKSYLYFRIFFNVQITNT